MIDQTRIAYIRAELGTSLFADLTELLFQEMDQHALDLAAAPPGPSRTRQIILLADCAADLGFVAVEQECRCDAIDDCAAQNARIAALLEASRDALGRYGLSAAA